MEESRSRMGLYIGDTMADFLTVKNLNQQHKNQPCLFSLVLNSNFARNNYQKQKEHYLNEGVDILAENVNQVVCLVHNKID